MQDLVDRRSPLVGGARVGAGLPDAARCASSCLLRPAGPADVYARFIAQRLQAALGQPFVVENKPGRGLTGTQEAAQAAPDGYTLLMMSNTHTVNETLIANRPYQLMRDFAPVAPVNYSDLVLVVNPGVPVSNVAELLALARSKPGQTQLRLLGAGHAVSHGRRAVQVDGQHRRRARARTKAARGHAPTCWPATCR